MNTVYGIKNCDTVKKALKILDNNSVKYNFIDLKKSSDLSVKVLEWKESLGDWPVNKKGTTFRKFKDEWERAHDKEKLILIVNNSSLIKRPVLEYGKGKLAIGLDKELYESLS